MPRPATVEISVQVSQKPSRSTFHRTQLHHSWVWRASSHILETFAHQCLLQHHSQQLSCLAKEEVEANPSRGLRGLAVGEGREKGMQRIKGAIYSTYKIYM